MQYREDKVETFGRIKVSKKLVTVNTISALVTQLFSVGALVWLQQYLVRRISVEEFSLLPVLVAVINLLPLITEFFSAGITRFVIEAYANEDEERASMLLSSIVPFVVFVAVFLFFSGVIVSARIELFLNVPAGREDEASLMFFLLLLTFIVSFTSYPFSCGFDICQQYVLKNLITTSFELFRLLVLFALLYLKGASVMAVVIANAFSSISCSVIFIIVSRRLVPSLRFRVGLFDFQAARELFSFGLWSLFGQIADRIRTTADPILLNLFSSPLAVTNFHLGSFFIRKLDTVGPLLFNSIQPVLIALHAKGETERLKMTFYRLNKYFLWGLMFCVAPLVVFRKELVVCYVGNAYLDASVVIWLLMVPTALAGSVQLVWNLGAAVGRIKGLALAGFGYQVVNLVLTYVLLSHFSLGAVGAALATCICSTFGIIFFILPISLSIVGGRLNEYFIHTVIPGFFPSLSMTVIWILIKNIHAIDSLYSFAVCLALGGAGNLFTLAFCLSTEDKDDLGKIYRNYLVPVIKWFDGLVFR